MAFKYRVVDLRSDVIDADGIFVEGARSPEDAVAKALDIAAVRSGARQDLVARVYWQPVGSPTNMVRLYRKVADRPNSYNG